MPLFIPQIFSGEQDLSDCMVIGTKKSVIDIHQFALTHGSGSLFGRHVGRPLSQVEFSDTHTDSA